MLRALVGKGRKMTNPMAVKLVKWWRTSRLTLEMVAHFASHDSVPSIRNISLRSFLRL